jgi:ribonuclease T2
MRQQKRRVTKAGLWLAAFLCLCLPGAAAFAGGQAGNFDLYVLSLSWSPEYCAGHQNDATQCAADQHNGLVVHGLWPQFAEKRRDPATGENNAWPDNCPAPQLGAVPPQAAATWPSSGLFRHEWQTHGSCSGLAPLDYATLAASLRQRFQTPPALLPMAADETVTAADLKAAIVNANADLPAAAVTLACRKGRLTEIRLCLDRGPDHGYMACPAIMARESSCPRKLTIHGLSD